jgi:vancomycin resistance protein YoaR
MEMNLDSETKTQPKHGSAKASGLKNKRAVKKGIIIASCAFVAAFAAAVVTLLAAVPKDVIASGVYADNINLSGMTKEEAKAAIDGHDFFSADNITVVSGGNKFDIPTDSIALTVDADKTVEKAFAIGKSGNKISDAKDVLVMRFSDKKTDIVPNVDENALNEQLSEFGKQLYGELAEHSVEVQDDCVVVTPGKTGASTDYTEANSQVLNAIANGKFTDISVTMRKQEPQDVDVDSLYNEVYVEPKDAEFETTAKSAKVASHVVGIELDKDDAKDKVSKIKEGGDPVEIKVIKTMPAVTKNMLENKLFNTTLASYSTKYSASNTNRSANLALAASNMNGTVLAPGETFSYNDVVGERTAARGFKNAPVYENGKSVDGIGGGVCQVSTTLYSAVLYADLKIVSRQNHSLPVSYVPLGQDATVVDGSIDFKFQNNTDYPIKVVSSAGGGTISVSIVGTERETERKVELVHNTLSKIEPTTKEVKTDSLPAGTTKVVSSGKAGYVVESTKIVYENGKEVSRTSLGKSTYKMVQKEVEVGTGASAQAAQTQAPEAQAAQPAQSAQSLQTTPQTTAETASNENKQTSSAETTLAAVLQDSNKTQ